VLILFSVNSFLYGFYISPVLAAQKSRIEELHKIVCAEANAIFTMMLTTLTHKKAKEIWKPFQMLLKTRCYSIVDDIEFDA